MMDDVRETGPTYFSDEERRGYLSLANQARDHLRAFVEEMRQPGLRLKAIDTAANRKLQIIPDDLTTPATWEIVFGKVVTKAGEILAEINKEVPQDKKIGLLTDPSQALRRESGSLLVRDLGSTRVAPTEKRPLTVTYSIRTPVIYGR